MPENKTISVAELMHYGSVDDLNAKAVSLVRQQQYTWDLAGKNYSALSTVQKRQFNVGAVRIEANYNPGRIRSSAASTDAKSISSRPCFLCEHNLPRPQKGIAYNDAFLILTNPYPIFPLHLTIAHKKHLPQQLGHFFNDLLELSRQLHEFTVFYNGPQCGASAPDHFHFQAGNNGVMPIEKEVEELAGSNTKTLITAKDLDVYAVDDGLRRFVILDSKEISVLSEIFDHLYSSLITNRSAEPMMNVLSLYKHDKWKVIIFPREKQRPSHYFMSDEHQLLVSPAAVEMGGLLILPRHDDFLKLDNNLISEVYGEVTASQNTFQKMVDVLTHWKTR